MSDDGYDGGGGMGDDYDYGGGGCVGKRFLAPSDALKPFPSFNDEFVVRRTAHHRDRYLAQPFLCYRPRLPATAVSSLPTRCHVRR